MLKEQMTLKQVLSSAECVNADGKYFFENLEENRDTCYFCGVDVTEMGCVCSSTMPCFTEFGVCYWCTVSVVIP